VYNVRHSGGDMTESNHHNKPEQAIGGMLEQTDSFKLEQAIGMQVNRTAFLMTEEITKRFAKHGYQLSTQDFGILYRLREQGAMTQVDIATLMMRDKTTITRRIDALVKKGLVERTPCKEDRRCFRIGLTDEGLQTIATITPLVRDFQHEVLSDIPDHEKVILHKTLKQISSKLIEIR